MPYAKIEGLITDPALETALSQINAIKEALPFLVNLTKKERQEGGYWKADHFSFLKTTETGLSTFPELVSASFDEAGWRNGLALYEKIRLLYAAASQLHEALDDTHLALRIQLQRRAGDFMKAARVAEKNDVPGTTELVNKLQECLPKRKKKNPKKAESGA